MIVEHRFALVLGHGPVEVVVETVERVIVMVRLAVVSRSAPQNPSPLLFRAHFLATLALRLETRELSPIQSTDNLTSCLLVALADGSATARVTLIPVSRALGSRHKLGELAALGCALLSVSL